MEDIKSGIKILRLLKQIANIIKHSMKYECKDYDITGPQGILLGILSHYGEMKISELSKKLGLSNSTVSAMVDRLERQGLLERKRSKVDKRVVYVNVTSKFKDVFEKHFTEVEGRLQKAIERACPEDLNKIVEGLETLKKVLEEEVM